MKNFKSGYVSIIGRTNVGKSTLLNSLCGTKLAAMANKPQTTRNNIKGIVNSVNYQIVFTDTPGIHKPKNRLSEKMIEEAYLQIDDCDVLIYIIEADKNEIGKGDREILTKIKEANKKTILLINKIDLVKKENLLKIIDMYRNEFEFSEIIPISILEDSLDEVVNAIVSLLPNGPKYYADDELTDTTEKSIIEDFIREKCLKLLNEEVPHGIFVQVERMKQRRTIEKELIYDIEATIYCLRNSHKGIIIGKNGEMLKRISTYARQDIENLLDCKVNLKVWVKVKENWQDDEIFLNKIYGIKK